MGNGRRRRMGVMVPARLKRVNLSFQIIIYFLKNVDGCMLKIRSNQISILFNLAFF